MQTPRGCDWSQKTTRSTKAKSIKSPSERIPCKKNIIIETNISAQHIRLRTPWEVRHLTFDGSHDTWHTERFYSYLKKFAQFSPVYSPAQTLTNLKEFCVHVNTFLALSHVVPLNFVTTFHCIFMDRMVYFWHSTRSFPSGPDFQSSVLQFLTL